MPFVKLDQGMLDSSLWIDKEARDLFITALLMAVPHVVDEPTPALKIRDLEPSGFVVPEGVYGIVRAAGVGIIARCGESDREKGLAALERLAAPDSESRTEDHQGRRMVRISGGYVILNFEKYRELDITAAERAKRYREKKAKLDAEKAATVTVTPVTGDDRDSVTQGEGDAEGDVEAEAQKDLLLGGERRVGMVDPPVEFWIPCVGAAVQAKSPKRDRFLSPARIVTPEELPELERWSNGRKQVCEYGITVALIAELMASFPGVDVRAELRGLIAWSRANSNKRRTYGRMAAWLTGRVGSRQDAPRTARQGDVAGGTKVAPGLVCNRCEGAGYVMVPNKFGHTEYNHETGQRETTKFREQCARCQGTGRY